MQVSGLPLCASLRRELKRASETAASRRNDFAKFDAVNSEKRAGTIREANIKVEQDRPLAADNSVSSVLRTLMGPVRKLHDATVIAAGLYYLLQIATTTGPCITCHLFWPLGRTVKQFALPPFQVVQ
jgi:hypothetical protein